MSEATTYLELRDLRVSYGKVEALHGISVHVEQGEIVTILGANGAGKTTTLTTISGLRKPSGGSILFQGRPLHTIPSHEIVRLGITQSPEGRRVFGTLSVRENLDLGAFTSKDRGRSAKIRKWIFDLFPRLAEREGQLAGTLSCASDVLGYDVADLVLNADPDELNDTRNAQPALCVLSVGIARALMADPKVLLLDEPSLGLAPLLVRSIFDSVRKINRQGVTVILVEQNARAALKLASRGYVIEVGRVVMEDASEALLANPDVQAAYLGGGQENGQEN